MKIYTIENDSNNITAHATVQEADAVTNAERFRNEAGLSKLAADWPASRLLEIWNSLPGVTPIKKFKDRQTAVSRIWKALETLGQTSPAATEPTPVPEGALVPDQIEETRVTIEPAAVAESIEPAPATPVTQQAPDVAPAEAPSTKKTTARKAAPKAPKAATVAKSDGPREGSKMAQVISMLQRENGATISEIMASMGWQKHTVRGFVAGAMKKAGFSVESFKPEGGERTYRISK
jgi:Protein of unknown function (DUF3489)